MLGAYFGQLQFGQGVNI